MKYSLICLFLSLVFCLSAHSISGTIRNTENYETVPFVNCIIEETGQGVISNERGYYVFSRMNPGTYTLRFQTIGYKVTRKMATLEDISISLDVYLAPVQVEIEGITVFGRHDLDNKDFYIPLSEMKISPSQIEELPQLAEADLFRAVQLLPGVSAISDYSSGLYIRGGSPDQNQILLDGIDVYNPSHLMGFFSTFNVDAIKTVDLIKGGFDAKYGGRLSSVMNVYNLDGNRRNFDGNLNISLITSKATFSGPWTKGSWMISGRRTYLEVIDVLMNPDLPGYYFYDGHAKFNYDLSQRTFLQYSFYTGKDVFKLDKGINLNIDWGNNTHALSCTHIFSPNFYGNLLLAFSFYGSNIDFALDEFSMIRKNRLYDYTVKSNFTWQPDNSNLIEFGFEEKFYNVVFKSEYFDEQYEPSFPDVNEKSVHSSAYVMNNCKINPLTLIKYGLRFDYYNRGRYMRLSPRVSLRYFIRENIALYGATGRYYQFLTSIDIPEASFFDLWFPLDETVKPLESNHYILGTDINLLKSFSLNCEFYYKTMKNITAYNEEVDYTYDSNKGLQQVYHIGKGYAYGADFLLNNDFGGMSGFISYSYGTTKQKFPGLNESLSFFPKFDRRHQVTLAQNYYYGSYVFGTSLTYGSGQPINKPIGILESESIGGYPENIVIYGRPDSARLPSYSRLDISARRIFYRRKYTIEPYFQIINVLNNKNINSKYYYRDGDYIKSSSSKMLPFIPTIGVSAKW